MRSLLDTVIDKIKNFVVKADRFSVIKETLKKDYDNFKFRQPYQQAMYNCSLILDENAWPWNEELEVLPHLEVEHLANFSSHLLSRTFLECFVSGNIEPVYAEVMVQHIESVLFQDPQPICKPLFPSQHLTSRIVKLERGIKYCFSIDCLNPSDENSALLHYIQVHRDDIKLNVLLELFALIAKQPTFHQLRSVEQLGYITVLMQRNDSGVRGLQFIIQSTVKDPAQLDARVETFLKMFDSELNKMTESDFKDEASKSITRKDGKVTIQKNIMNAKHDKFKSGKKNIQKQNSHHASNNQSNAKKKRKLSSREEISQAREEKRKALKKEKV